jgi:hypothetical protein
MEHRKLREIAKVVRSKNAKPFRITLDVIFDRRDVFDYVKGTNELTVEAVSKAYGLPVESFTSSFVFDTGMAFKFTFRRPVVQGALGDSDIYGAQQHAPLLDLAIPWSEVAPAWVSPASSDEMPFAELDPIRKEGEPRRAKS